MDKEQIDHSRETGEKVWESLRMQMAEGRGFLHAMFVSFRRFVRKNVLYFLLFGILGSAVATAIWFARPKVYTAEMTVSYVHYEKKIYADMLKKLDLLISSGSFSTLAEMLGMEENEVKEMKSVRGYNIRREDLTGDLSTEKIPFYIVVEVSDLEILTRLESALVNYLNGTDYIRDRLDFMRKQSEAELAFLEQRLAVADSLSRTLTIRGDILPDEKTITRMELLEETMAIYDRLKQVRGSLAFNLNVEILDGFIPSEDPSGKGLRQLIILGFMAGVALWVVILLFR